MIKVIFNEEDLQDADNYAVRMKSRQKTDPTELMAQKGYRPIGFLAERAFEKYLKHIGAKYRAFGTAKDRPDKNEPFDFLVGKKRTDVKGTTKYFQIAVNEWKAASARRNADILVGVCINRKDDTALILGYCAPDKLSPDPKKDFNYNGKKIKMYSVSNREISNFKTDNIIVY